MKNINIFVYGSLREGFFNYEKYLAGKVAEIRDGKLKNMKLYHMDYKGYPAIIHGDETIIGEIMVINKDDYESAMKAIDKMEGFISDNNPENEYHKVILEVENLYTNKKEKCFVYFYNKDKDINFEDKAQHISSGDWKSYMLNNIK